jgi:hypothetical protein
MNRETTLQERLGSTRAEEGQSTPFPGSGDDQSLDGTDMPLPEPESPESPETDKWECMRWVPMRSLGHSKKGCCWIGCRLCFTLGCFEWP